MCKRTLFLPLLLALLALLALQAASVTAAASPKPRVRLLAPASGATFPKRKRSPLFRWRVSGAPKRTVIIIQLSSDPHFRAAAVAHTKLCTRADCWTSYRWKTSEWWRESDACAYTPAHGVCKNGQTTSGRYYWRVGVSTGRHIIYSAVSNFQSPLRKHVPHAPGAPEPSPAASAATSAAPVWPWIVSAVGAALFVAAGVLLLWRRGRS